jgi:hypothetical protein
MTPTRTGAGAPTAEEQRLQDSSAAWKRWGPYLSERQWGTVREDYSDSGNAWDYFYLDSTPTHSYMKWLCQYPQAAFPYSDLMQTNRQRTRAEMEYELLDTTA